MVNRTMMFDNVLSRALTRFQNGIGDTRDLRGLQRRSVKKSTQRLWAGHSRSQNYLPFASARADRWTQDWKEVLWLSSRSYTSLKPFYDPWVFRSTLSRRFSQSYASSIYQIPGFGNRLKVELDIAHGTENLNHALARSRAFPVRSWWSFEKWVG